MSGPPEATDSALADATEKLCGRRPGRIERVPAGLGDRCFHRLHFGGGSPVTMIARVEATSRLASPLGERRPDLRSVPTAPAWLAEPALEPIRGLLEAYGLPVPRSYGHDAALGLDLLEDLGSRTVLDLDPHAAAARIREACAFVPRLQRIVADATEVPAFSRRLDRALISTKAWKWLHWTIPLVLGREASVEEVAGTTALFEHIADLAESAPNVLSHRDFKAENLHLAPPDANGGPERLVMIDVQGAFLAPPEYDLVCLLYDLQSHVPEEVATELREATRVALPSPPPEAVFAERFDALAISRLCKDLSQVVHASLVRGDTRRWHELPRGLELLRRAAGRRGHTFPGMRALHSVIPALTTALHSADSPEGFGALEGR